LEEGAADYEAIRRGWCLGDNRFRRGLPAHVSERLGAEHYGSEREEAAEAKAERIISDELSRRRWKESDVERRAKGDRVKIALAMCPRRETLVTVKWIAARLHLGTAGYVNNRLYRWRKELLR
jgi:hypothetical protein